ncbi:hypothetical protein QS795_004970 [Providencia zhijiangensis]|uniref:Uncharacterized protein n=1 Tax=Providencia zhijiangensis TaxID=3053982 RepID=A0ABZ0N478_9GAMM|nr:hypothetical protein [Providencia sp. D4759]MTC72404.1 hypothetical protein [Providencia sp. wls1914]MTC75658.1 hypothetical protein [Providencia sp. wls1919]WPA93124.1 hypothetical protein QS795_004970 [Providencia sp. D4759]
MSPTERKVISNVFLKSLKRQIEWEQTKDIHPAINQSPNFCILGCYNTTNLDNMAFYLYSYRTIDFNHYTETHNSVVKFSLTLIENNCITWNTFHDDRLLTQLFEITAFDKSSIHKFMESCEN